MAARSNHHGLMCTFDSIESAVTSPCFAERSTATEEAAQYNFTLDEIPTVPSCPQYQSIDPSTLEPANYEQLNSRIYEELDFGTLNNGHVYDEPEEGNVDREYLEPVDIANLHLPTGNTVSNECNNPDEDNEYLEPVDISNLPTRNTVSSECDNPNEDNEYLEPVDIANLPTGNAVSNECDNLDESNEYLEPLY